MARSNPTAGLSRERLIDQHNTLCTTHVHSLPVIKLARPRVAPVPTLWDSMLLVKRFSPPSSKDTMHPKTDRLHGSTSGYMVLPSSVSKTLPVSHVKVQRPEKRTSLAHYERLNILEKDRRLEADMKMKKIMQQASAEMLKTTKRISRGDRVEAKPSSFVEKNFWLVLGTPAVPKLPSQHFRCNCDDFVGGDMGYCMGYYLGIVTQVSLRSFPRLGGRWHHTITSVCCIWTCLGTFRHDRRRVSFQALRHSSVQPCSFTKRASCTQLTRYLESNRVS
jgi:hypothetical protein